MVPSEKELVTLKKWGLLQELYAKWEKQPKEKWNKFLNLLCYAVRQIVLAKRKGDTGTGMKARGQ